MLTAIKKSMITASIIVSLSLATHATAATDPSKSYKHDGYISSVDKVKRLLTINGQVYEAAIGIKLENLPKNQRYSGLDFISSGLNVFFTIKPGTEKSTIPTITKMWVVAD